MLHNENSKKHYTIIKKGNFLTNTHHRILLRTL